MTGSINLVCDRLCETDYRHRNVTHTNIFLQFHLVNEKLTFEKRGVNKTILSSLLLTKQLCAWFSPSFYRSDYRILLFNMTQSKNLAAAWLAAPTMPQVRTGCIIFLLKTALFGAQVASWSRSCSMRQSPPNNNNAKNQQRKNGFIYCFFPRQCSIIRVEGIDVVCMASKSSSQTIPLSPRTEGKNIWTIWWICQ